MSSAGARQSIVLLDRSGRPFYGLPNIDNRGREYMDTIRDRDTVYRLSGKWVTEDFCAAKLLGLRMRRPELYEQVGTVLSISEWIAHIFTGVSAMEPSQACETQLYDLEKRAWSPSLCAAYGVDRDLLPPLLPAVLASMEDRLEGFVFALAFGVLCDLALTAPLPCLYTIAFPLTALLAALIARSVLQPGILCSLAVSTAAFVLVDLMTAVTLLAGGRSELSAIALRAVQELALSLPLLIVCHPVLAFLHRKFTL